MQHPEITLPRTQALLVEGLAAGLHIGAQVYVSKGGEVLADFAIGEARPGVRMETDTVMPWLSSGKPLTSIAIGQLQEQGKLQWDDPVARFIPQFGCEGKESVTVRHLLTHTAGFRAADKISDALGWDATIERICQTPLEPDWPIGEKAGYHISSSWMILGEIVRRVSGRAFWDVVRQEICVPAGMNDSWLGMPKERAREYGNRLGVMQRTDSVQSASRDSVEQAEDGITRYRPGSDAHGPIRELGRFYEALIGVGSNAFVQPETVRLMCRRHRAGLFDETFRHAMDWGLGFMLNSNRYGLETVPYGFGRNASDESFGHSGAQSSTGFGDPVHGLVVAWVCNGMPGERKHQSRARELNSALYVDLRLA